MTACFAAGAFQAYVGIVGYFPGIIRIGYATFTEGLQYAVASYISIEFIHGEVFVLLQYTIEEDIVITSSVHKNHAVSGCSIK